MKRLGLVLALLSAPAVAQDRDAFAVWGESSGSLPPEYAWDYTVSFFPDRHGEVTYCKGYSDAPPGCATTRFRLTRPDFAALQTALAPLEADLAAKPAAEAVDIPVGGGSVGGRLQMNGRDLRLPAFPAEADAARVDAVIRLLRENTPERAVRSAKSKARAP